MVTGLEQLYDELQLMKAELVSKQLEKGDQDDLVSTFIRDELVDINNALQKINNGTYGQCEFSGELIPMELMATMPTLKTTEDMAVIEHFFKKPLHLDVN